MKFDLKKQLKKVVVTFTVSCLALSSVTSLNIFAESSANYLPAFPGAEGGGKFATGGRNGTIYHVTNLNDSGAGSFRDAVGASNRIVVFDVAGTIELKSDVVIKSNVTVAGQTAPGGKGITLKNYKVGLGGDNIILRFISSRPGERGTNADYDALGGSMGSNSIVDHCSIGWANDEQWGLYSNNTNQTVQWSLIGPANSFSYHSKGIHGFGVMFGKGQNSWHHNMIAHNISRNFRGKVEGTSTMDFVNNVIYDWGYQTAYGTLGHLNYANNYLKAGTSTKGGYKYINLSSGSNYDKFKFYLTGNKMVDKDGNVINGENDNWQAFNYGSVKDTYGYDEAYYRTDSYMPLLSNGIDVSVAKDMDTADVAFDKVTKYAGAGISKDCKPQIDLEVMQEAINGTGSITGARPLSEANSTQDQDIQKYNINQVDYSNYYPKSNLKKDIIDSDNDGMPDEWEIARGLDPENASDATGDYLGKGYNNIEYYINDLTVNAFPEGTVIPSTETVNHNYVTTNWKASESVAAYSELMEGLFVKGDITYSAASTSVDNVKFSGYVTGIKQTAPLVFEPSYDGEYTIYYRLGGGKTFKTVDDNGNVVSSNENSSSNTYETSTKISVTAGKVYYTYVEGSNAYFYGAKFERLKTASPINNYLEYTFDLSSDKGTNVCISDSSRNAQIQVLPSFRYHSMGGYDALVGDIFSLKFDGNEKYLNTKIEFDLLYPNKAAGIIEVFDSDDTTYSNSLAKSVLTSNGINSNKLVFDALGGHSYIVRVTSDSSSYLLTRGIVIKTKGSLCKINEETPSIYEFDLTSDNGTNTYITDINGKAYIKALSNFRYHSMGGYNALIGDIFSLTFDGNKIYENTTIEFDFLYPDKATGTVEIYDINDMETVLASTTADGTNPISLKFDAIGGHTYIVKVVNDSVSYFLVKTLNITTNGKLIQSDSVIATVEVNEYNSDIESVIQNDNSITNTTIDKTENDDKSIIQSDNDITITTTNEDGADTELIIQNEDNYDKGNFSETNNEMNK